MNNVSNYNVFDIKVDENGITNITPRMLYELLSTHLIVMRSAVGDLNDYTGGVHYFVNADKEGDYYLMKLQCADDTLTYKSSNLNSPFNEN